MSIEKNIEKVVDQNVEQITRDFKSFIPDNIVEIAIGYSISFVFALLIFFIGKWISKSVVKILGKALRKVGGVDETLVKFLENIVYYALLTVVIIAALNKLGIATTSFLAILGAAGLAVGLALKDSLGNFASGVMIVLFKPFKAGDSVVAGGVSGTVTEVTIFNTVFLTADNQKIIVPNSSITSGSITNVNANNTRRVDIVVAISYEDSIKNAKDVLTNIINSNPKVLKDKGFGISVTDLAETSVKLGVNVWAKSSDYGSLKAELLEEIKIKFDEVGITIPYSKNVYQQIKN
ncbi:MULTISPECIES: mechanosensitive ion channel family protein [Aliarcobacter]|jgi:small conductance mechanosensitive channel|uniref:Mechanosensitive ion channel n=7 Tax=Arcobacteraceae TaxID=2808963 RepID=A0A1V9VB55_9BACT|nr:mechanosensitive ion channel domain-containing protein [Aliarcobacter cryaerophilus]OQA74309.1 MAG: Small-conductance mechanosensitive channel [Candidatus Dependentiae bacterium ADurb.Bin246]WNL12869.1 mechanosensitive ion channel [Arcobacter sp. AZ-2023]WPD06312.1 mechanosensitive ion channel [Arcobacter sp. DSM 115956]WPD08403.1 mechanosensitive ion channel [Arcobacter sp. DSM 115955]WPD09355.1 mechanosensitive ion channel [Arcobacter sp. DSM 115954]WPD11352.1 mechanosensitive ion channe